LCVMGNIVKADLNFPCIYYFRVLAFSQVSCTAVLVDGHTILV